MAPYEDYIDEGSRSSSASFATYPSNYRRLLVPWLVDTRTERITAQAILPGPARPTLRTKRLKNEVKVLVHCLFRGRRSGCVRSSPGSASMKAPPSHLPRIFAASARGAGGGACGAGNVVYFGTKPPSTTEPTGRHPTEPAALGLERGEQRKPAASALRAASTSSTAFALHNTPLRPSGPFVSGRSRPPCLDYAPSRHPLVVLSSALRGQSPLREVHPLRGQCYSSR